MLKLILKGTANLVSFGVGRWVGIWRYVLGLLRRKKTWYQKTIPIFLNTIIQVVGGHAMAAGLATI